jgi:hypothetical protein
MPPTQVSIFQLCSPLAAFGLESMTGSFNGPTSYLIKTLGKQNRHLPSNYDMTHSHWMNLVSKQVTLVTEKQLVLWTCHT